MALLAHTIKGSPDGDTVTTDPIDTTGADIIVISNVQFAAFSTITDNKDNTWTAINQTGALGFFGGISQHYCLNPTVGPGHTFTSDPGGSNGRPSIAVSAWSGGVSLQDFGGAGAIVGTTRVTGEITPLAAGELMTTCFGFENADTVSVDPAFTIIGQIPYSGGLHAGLAHASGFAPSTSNIAATWTWSSAMSNPGCLIASFTYEEPPVPMIAPFIVGLNTNVTATRAAAFGLDGNTNVHDEAGKLKVFGRGEFTEDLKVIDPVDAQDAVPKHYCDANGGAPVGAQYVALATDATLTAERVLTGSARVSVTDSGAGAAVTLDIPTDAVDYARMQNVSAASRLLGRGSAGGAGNIEEITLGAGLSMSGTALTSTSAGSAWSVLTNGDPASPEIVFDSNGDVVMVETLR